MDTYRFALERGRSTGPFRAMERTIVARRRLQAVYRLSLAKNTHESALLCLLRFPATRPDPLAFRCSSPGPARRAGERFQNLRDRLKPDRVGDGRLAPLGSADSYVRTTRVQRTGQPAKTRVN